MLAQLFKGRRNVFKRRHEREFQRQPPTDVPMKRCSGNMQRITGEHPCRSVILKSHFGMGVLL